MANDDEIIDTTDPQFAKNFKGFIHTPQHGKAQDREQIHAPAHMGDKIADLTVAGIGTWRFIIIQSVILALWLVLNSVGWFYHWDSAPFILLNLCLSFQAAFTGPIVLLSQNRQAARDRKRDDVESVEVQEMYQSHQLLLEINRQQSEVLDEQTEMLELIRQLLHEQPKRGIRPVHKREVSRD